MKNWKHGSAILNSCVGLCIIQVRAIAGTFYFCFRFALAAFFLSLRIFFFCLFLRCLPSFTLRSSLVPSFYSPALPFSPHFSVGNVPLNYFSNTQSVGITFSPEAALFNLMLRMAALLGCCELGCECVAVLLFSKKILIRFSQRATCASPRYFLNEKIWLRKHGKKSSRHKFFFHYTCMVGWQACELCIQWTDFYGEENEKQGVW